MNNTGREEEIFDQAIRIDDHDRQADFVRQASEGDTALVSRVEALLACHAKTADFLETPALGFVRREHDGPMETAGRVIDRYRLIEEVGEGGFGQVFRAEQLEPVTREVAVKIIKPGMDSRQVVARFRAEQQTLAMMKHPGIATVLDAGTTESGRPYFAMELVDGQPIDDDLDERRSDVAQRLRLFADVCRAVHHAHQKGVIHRDLKPPNVLITDGDEWPAVKVIDFGIAKAMQPAGEAGNTTARQFLGTPQYMSPEQIAGEADIDTRADVYALGCLLYKLLTGVAPLDDQVASADANVMDLRRRVCEEEPRRPSTRLGELGDNLPTVAQQRATRPAELRRTLRGDLDWIVMKALEKDRQRRYQSASELAADVERFLASEPVSAGPPTALYRLQKLARRHRAVVSAASLVVAALMVGAVASTIGFLNAERQRKRADEQRVQVDYQRQQALKQAEKAQRTVALLQEMIGAAHPREGHSADYTVRELLDEVSQSLEERLPEQPEARAALHQTIGRAYLFLWELDKAQTHLKQALDLRQQNLGEEDPQTASSQADYAYCVMHLSRLEEAKETASSAVKRLRQEGPSDDLALALGVLARVNRVYGEPDEALRLANEALDITKQVHGKHDPTTLINQLRVAASSTPADAETLARDALVRLREVRPDDHFDVAMAKFHVAMFIRAREPHEAEQLLREALETHRRTTSDGSAFVIKDLIILAEVLFQQSRNSEAEQLARQAVALLTQAVPPNHSLRAQAYRQLAVIIRRDDPEAALVAWTKALEAQKQLLGDHPEMASWYRRRGQLYRALGQTKEAVADYRSVLAVFPEETHGDTADRTQALYRFCDVLIELNDVEQAKPYLEQVMAADAPSDQKSALICLDLIEWLARRAQLEDADKLVEKLETTAADLRHPLLQQAAAAGRAWVLMGQGEHQEAESLLRDVFNGLPGRKYPRFALRVACVMAVSDARQGRTEEADLVLQQWQLQLAEAPSRFNSADQRMLDVCHQAIEAIRKQRAAP